MIGINKLFDSWMNCEHGVGDNYSLSDPSYILTLFYLSPDPLFDLIDNNIVHFLIYIMIFGQTVHLININCSFTSLHHDFLSQSLLSIVGLID